MAVATKKTIQSYWTQNVPGLDIASKKYTPEEKAFYLEADNLRFKYEPYVLPLLDSFAEKGKLVLEIGCGLGSDSRHMLKKGIEVVSLDLSPRNAYFTLKGISLMGMHGRGICADAEYLPFRDASFDIVYSFGVLHHTPNTAKAIEEVRRVLKPGGKAVVMLYHKGYAYYLLIMRYGWKKLLGLWKNEKLMSEYDHTPLSKLYSHREASKLFNGFKNIQIEMTTYGGIQAHPLLKFIYSILTHNKFLMHRLGSFIIIRAEK
jgi:ubiquinone/menaquinone biosynthesis C-methylase UbiE